MTIEEMHTLVRAEETSFVENCRNFELIEIFKRGLILEVLSELHDNKEYKDIQRRHSIYICYNCIKVAKDKKDYSF